MTNKVEILNHIDVEGYLARLDMEELTLSSHRYFHEQGKQLIEQKLAAFMANYPAYVTLELFGPPPNWGIRIAKCDWWRRPALWMKLKSYRKRLRRGPIWNLQQSRWEDQNGNPLSESAIKRLGLTPETDVD